MTHKYFFGYSKKYSDNWNQAFGKTDTVSVLDQVSCSCGKCEKVLKEREDGVDIIITNDSSIDCAMFLGKPNTE